MNLIEGENARYCTKCDKLKAFAQFHKQKEGKYGYKAHCKSCCKFKRQIEKEYGRFITSKRFRYTKNKILKEDVNAKVCSTCDILKTHENFYKHPEKKDNLDSQCISCIKKYREENKEMLKKASKIYKEKNWERMYQKRRVTQLITESIDRNFERFRDHLKQSRYCNECNIYKPFKKFTKSKAGKYGRNGICKKCRRPKMNEYQNNRLRTDTEFKLERYIRSRIWFVLKDIETTSRQAYKYLGCTTEKLKEHIESQFEEGMSWDNYAYDTWHIDHIKPCAAFDLSDPQQQKECFHYTNLQPLWAEENLKKGAKYEG